MVSIASARAFVLGGLATALILAAVPLGDAPRGARPASNRIPDAPVPAPPPASPRATRKVLEPIQPENEPIQPVPEVREFFEDYLGIEYDPRKVELGRLLFHDASLSASDTISCATCHDLRYAGTDQRTHPLDVDGCETSFNTRTVFNAALNAPEVGIGEEVVAPLELSGEDASTWTTINTKLLANARIVGLLREVYGLQGELGPELDRRYWLEAIVDFERTLLTPGAPFDAYLRGDENAISRAAKEGYQLFKHEGCIDCHRGMAVGGGARGTAYFGAHQTRALEAQTTEKPDRIRRASHAPPLRNVEVTGPWFHDGSQPTLAGAVASMARTELERELSPEELERIVAFLCSLTGTHDGRPLKPAR